MFRTLENPVTDTLVTMNALRTSGTSNRTLYTATLHGQGEGESPLMRRRPGTIGALLTDIPMLPGRHASAALLFRLELCTVVCDPIVCNYSNVVKQWEDDTVFDQQTGSRGSDGTSWLAARLSATRVLFTNQTVLAGCLQMIISILIVCEFFKKKKKMNSQLLEDHCNCSACMRTIS